MNNAEQILRLLKELERLDRQTGEDPTVPAVTSSMLLNALVESDFDLTAAIVGVRSAS